MRYKIKENINLAGYVFISPWLIGFFAFLVIPVIISLYYSFTNYDLVGVPVFVGWKNYQKIFIDKRFWQAIKVTFIYTFTALPLRLSFALLLAVLFNQKHKFVGIYRTIFYIPSLIGGSVAVSVVWRQLFGYNGALNDILISMGILEQPIGFIGKPQTALWTLVLLAAWQFGSPMLIFLAGLKQIPLRLYESAAIDGASWWQKFYKITIPMLTPIIFFNLVMQTIRLFMMFTQAYIITHGGPIDSTLVYVLYLFKQAFDYKAMGYASALAWILLLVLGFVTYLLFSSSRYWVFYESEEGL
ncbi:MAG: sugar ABC transporter permease [Firmicutes bacterium]|nr:sugar ABC transporter permease [Bacillota bacterium]